MNHEDATSDHYFLRPVAFSSSRMLKRPRPAPIKTVGIRPPGIRNTTAYIENSKTLASEPIIPPNSPLSSALSTPRAIITAIPWKLRPRTSAAASPSSAFSFSSTSPSFQESALRLSTSPMESPSLPSGRVLKSPFSCSGSPYPFSPSLSAYESRLSPNAYRNIPRIDTNVQLSNSSAPNGRNIRTPVSNRRARQSHSQPVHLPINSSPLTPVAVELEFPIILDPVTPPVTYTFGTAAIPRLLSSSNEAHGPTRTRTRNDSRKRGRAPSCQDLRSQAVVSKKTTSAPRALPEQDMSSLLPSTVYDPNQMSTGSRASGKNEMDLPSKRSRRQGNINLDGYSRLSHTQQQSYTSRPG